MNKKLKAPYIELCADRLPVLSTLRRPSWSITLSVSGQRVARKLLLDHDCLTDDQGDTLVRALGVQQVEEVGEVTVKTLIACNELVGESEARHETTLLEPKDVPTRGETRIRYRKKAL
jgi:hypothetical protein